ncbi:MAG: serine protease [Bacteroidota bacterium]
MNTILQNCESIIIQIATSYSKEGTGFYWRAYDVIVTNEHIVRNHQEVIIEGKHLERQMTPVLFLDQKNDLALLKAPAPLKEKAFDLKAAKNVELEAAIIAIGHPFGQKFTHANGRLLTSEEGQEYLTHDAALTTSHNGGPLLNLEGELIGINAFLKKRDQYVGFTLPAPIIEKSIVEFQTEKGKQGSRCIACETIVYESGNATQYCPNCGAKITMLSMIEEYEPVGVSKTVEEILLRTGHEVKLARRGLNNWEIQEGSAKVIISYHEDSGLITGDAYLCLLPKEKVQTIYQFLLQQNKVTENLTFSVNPNGREIILSLLIYDRYLNVSTGEKLFKYLFERADYYDNILVENYGAIWKEEQVTEY